jgi:outer membrane protein assembly factor BamD (BamD/ComL family)
MFRIIITLLIVVLFASCESAKKKLSDEIAKGEARLFSDSVKSLNIDESNNVLNNYLVYADQFKDDTLSAEYLFKAADLANGLRRPKEAVAIFERLRTSFPEYRKTPAALFMQGFIYETSLGEKEKAKEKYKDFIQKYPNHTLTPSAQASLDQLNANLSDEELIRSFEEKNKLN